MATRPTQKTMPPTKDPHWNLRSWLQGEGRVCRPLLVEVGCEVDAEAVDPCAPSCAVTLDWLAVPATPVVGASEVEAVVLGGGAVRTMVERNTLNVTTGK